MARTACLAIAAICYAAFFAAFLYLIGFVAALPQLPTNVDKGLSAAPLTAALIDMGLIALFGVQHSVMARQGFKRGWTRIVPPPVERSVFCLASAAVLVAMFALWHPIAGSVWSVENQALRIALWALSGVGWAILLLSTFLINHFELFGLVQAWRHFRGQEAAPPKFVTPFFYRYVRHPLYSGFVIAFWATPEMTYSHLLLAAGFTAYILIGVWHEERDLVGQFGDDYLAYRRKVGGLFPGVGRRA